MLHSSVSMPLPWGTCLGWFVWQQYLLEKTTSFACSPGRVLSLARSRLAAATTVVGTRKLQTAVGSSELLLPASVLPC